MSPTESTAPKKRRGLPKTRTGCGTCKIRRVKCGEERPQCQRCIKFGCICDGYGHLEPRSDGQAAPALRPKKKIVLPRSAVRLEMILAPKNTLFKREDECRYFENFCRKTSYEILPNFNNDTIRQMLLQAAHQEPAIRHAIASLGALDVPTEDESQSGILVAIGAKTGTPSKHRIDALEQYSIALEHLRKAVSTGNQDLRLIMLACILTVCFEAWCGNIRKAVLQIASGQKLLHARINEALESGKEIHGSLSSGTADVMENDILHAFVGIDIDHDEKSTNLNPNIFEKETLAVLSHMPEVFSSIMEATMYRNALKLQTRRFLSRDSPVPDENLPFRVFRMNECWKRWCPIPKSVQDSYENLLSMLQRWKVAFEPTWQVVRYADHPIRVPAVQLLLDIRYMILEMTMTVEVVDEIDFDEHMELFSDIATFAEYVLERSETARRSFVLRHQTVLPLWMTACKSRHSNIRRKAISLLVDYPRREAAFDSLVFGRVAEWVADMEDAHLNQGKIPDWARIGGMEVGRDESGYEMTWTCLQRSSPEPYDVVLRTKIVDERRELSSRKDI